MGAGAGALHATLAYRCHCLKLERRQEREKKMLSLPSGITFPNLEGEEVEMREGGFVV